MISPAQKGLVMCIVFLFFFLVFVCKERRSPVTSKTRVDNEVKKLSKEMTIKERQGWKEIEEKGRQENVC